ncbi:MAG: FAD-dependent oxidoreductase, partial [Myxococcales bacterium]|nr:FAD-dependent oxidoreductase [Myxococcales bacterium]
YGSEFVDDHLVPMASAIWSAEPPRILDFPAVSFVRFYAQHGLLQRSGGPVWQTVEGGSQRYVEALTRPFADRIRTASPVVGVRRERERVWVRAAGHEPEAFDQVVLACHSDQALAMLEDPSPAEERILGAIRYQPNEAVLHTDVSLLPRQRRAWACWNVRVPVEPSDRVQVTYHMNQLQRIEATEQYCVTLNRSEVIDPARVLARFSYAHPVFDSEAIAAQELHDRISGLRRTHYCGAYWGYGFHEDGVRSALPVLEAFGTGLAP